MLQEALEIEIVTFTNTFCKKLIKDLLKDDTSIVELLVFFITFLKRDWDFDLKLLSQKRANCPHSTIVMILDLDADQHETNLSPWPLAFYEKKNFSLGMTKAHNIIIVKPFWP